MNDLLTSGDDGDEAAGPRALRELRDGYAALSRDYLDAGDLRMALLAMWAADVHVLQQLLLENGLDRAPDPAAQLAAVGDAVNSSLGAVSTEGAAPRQLLERSREAMVAAFDESVHAMLMTRFLSAAHLDAAQGLSVGPAAPAVERRLGGRTSDQLVAQLDATAHDCMAVAEAMVLVGDPGAALRQIHHADLASFEAVLLRTAMEAGDENLTSVDLGWELAARAFTQQPVQPVDSADIGATVTSWRERLVALGGWAHETRLRASFLPVPST
jgi:hypothetical protein